MPRARLWPAVGIALLLCACDTLGRGCEALRTVARPRATPADDGLRGTDCAPGLARCVGGGVEVSVAAHLPFPCEEGRARPETKASSCECPWKLVAQCGAAGCAVDEVVVAISEDAAERQLCAPREAVARAADGGVLPPCREEGTRCEGGVVVACDGPDAGHVVGACLHGCEVEVSVADGDLATGAGVLGILCRRTPAERR